MEGYEMEVTCPVCDRTRVLLKTVGRAVIKIHRGTCLACRGCDLGVLDPGEMPEPGLTDSP